MPSEDTPMVLRSINLPSALDDELRRVAFVLRRSKSDLIRLFVVEGLARLMNELKPESKEPRIDVLDDLSARINKTGRSYEGDFNRMKDFIEHQQGREVFLGVGNNRKSYPAE
jgi:hypothetical protein